MTFDQLAKGCTPTEREALAWHLAQYRARKTYDALKPEKRCFTYCGPELCDCGASGFFANNPHPQPSPGER